MQVCIKRGCIISLIQPLSIGIPEGESTSFIPFSELTSNYDTALLQSALAAYHVERGDTK